MGLWVLRLVIMADSVYISVNLTKPHLEFLNLLDKEEIHIFKLSDIQKQFDRKFKNLNEILENLVHKRLLIRIEKGKFCRPTFKNEFVVGTFVVENSAIAYSSALNLHGLTKHYANTIFIQTTNRKNKKNILGASYKFVRIAPHKRY